MRNQEAPKTCTVCNVLKPAEEFSYSHKYTSKKTGKTKRYRRKECIPCFGETYNKGRNGNAIRARAKKYGTTPEHIRELTAKPCEICGKAGPSVVDHDHDTGLIRGALCALCNSGLGMFGDSEVLVRKAARYLKQAHIRGGEPPSS